MPTQQIPNPTNAFVPSQGPTTGPNQQLAGYVELPNQDTVSLPVGTLVQTKITSNIVGVVRAAAAGAGGVIGVVTNVTPVGAIATVCTEGIVQAIADGTITAGHWLTFPATTAGSVADSAIANTATTAADSGLIVGYALTATTVGLLFWMYVEKM